MDSRFLVDVADVADVAAAALCPVCSSLACFADLGGAALSSCAAMCSMACDCDES